MASPTIHSLPAPVLLRICEFVSSRDVRGFAPLLLRARGDLRSLALTCRSLSEPALDALWFTLPYLGLLLSVLPTDLYELNTESVYECTRYQRTHSQCKMTLLRAPQPHEIARFSMYTKRVKSLGGGGGGFSPRDRRTRELLPFQESRPRIAELTLLAYDLAISESISSVVWSLLSALGIKPLLPSLRLLCHEELEWECCHPDYRQNAPLHTPSMLFGSKLLFADISCVDPNRNAEHATELVDALSGVATTLEYLNIEARPVRAQERASAERAGKRLRGPLVRRWRRAGVQ